VERVLVPLGAGAGIGVPGVDDHRLDAVLAEVELVDHDRRRLHLVGREDPGRVTGAVAVEHGQVVLLAGGDGRSAGREGLDPAGGGARPPAPGEGHGHWIGSTRPVVRSNPKARLKDSTPCPEAPLTRLSRALVTIAFSPCAATLTRQRLV